jgi:uncharacterized protein involved in type VI secretion and phage assembly
MFMDDLDYENNQSKVYGVVTAIVTNNKDEDGMGRVKVTYPWLAENDESHWARIATMMAGNDRGTYFIPEVDDEVLVAFEHGDIHFPYIIGSLWNGKDKVHETNADGKNNLRVIKSRSGHKVIFDDTDGKEKITIIENTEKRKIVIDSSAKTIDIINEDGDINITAGGNINIKTDKNFNVKAGSNIKEEASMNVDIKAGSNLTAKASASANIEATASMTVKGGTTTVKGSMTTVEASGITTVKGSLVKLN